MSYRDPDQALEDPIDEILSGISRFSRAVEARVDSNEWMEDHIDDLLTVRIELLKIDPLLRKIRSETW